MNESTLVTMLPGLWPKYAHMIFLSTLTDVITQFNPVFFLPFTAWLDSNSGSVGKPPKPSRNSIGDAVTTPQQQADEIVDEEVFPTSSSSDVSTLELPEALFV